jgi:hypothetical protein
MPWKRKVAGSVVATIGFLLSPLSWWNDLFVNLPIALAFAWCVACFFPKAFEESVVLGYWLTNIVGLILLHKGTKVALSDTKKISIRRELLWDLVISILYTVLIVALIKTGVLKPITGYFQKL